MNVLEQIYAKAKANPQKVAFPEAENEKMMAAAYQAGKDGYILPILVGDKEKILALAAERGYDAEVFTVVDICEEEYLNELVTKYIALPDSRLKEKALRRRMQNPLYYAMVMQAVDEADVTFAGIDNTTGDVLLAGQYIIGLQEGLSTVSSIGLCDIPGFEGSEGSLLAIGDSAVCTNPTSEQLADIAIAACNTVQSLLDWEPRCAMVCYSTLGSGQGELIDKVVEAVKIAQEKRPDLAIDGEFQFDAAISPTVAAKKVKRESKVAGRANVVIWPDLNVGNVGVKLIMVDGYDNVGGEGPMAPTRCGAIGVAELLNYIEKNNLEFKNVRKLLTSSGGFVSHVGISDAIEINRRAAAGDRHAEMIWKAMIYQLAKAIGAMAAVLEGKVDGILLGGGMVHNAELVQSLKDYCGWIAPVTAYPGEFEMEAMAAGANRVLNGEEELKTYTGKLVWEKFDWE